ncbi:BadF/BadG/BcrA/BcrD ATPase family protein [Actinacidiphila oryziradicis]|jgi:N-acetylglucosamine kinase-like BadF-type ATPase|uniref:N-acetylglucosamine kinase n=1 Tax=Actinacidiphila oryziradicis TaxID=2571141 RepID=UPI0023EFE12F|nr:BadF/BadG/BcrA/BcrD ATPase family protein [Actinacidiphila oryziradicis]MCW2873300.1 ATPase [Actinacidiphila oryziradicis]
MRVLVGADVGGTKLAVRVETLDGVVRADLRCPADGWDASAVGSAASWLMDHLAGAVPEGDEIVAVGIGAQGCDTQEHCARLAEAVEALGVPAVVVNDAALLVPAAGLDAGIGVIAGTGSIGVGTDADGTVLFAGGWGWVLGDEASAPAIVREATKAALAAYDDRQPDDGLLRALLAHFGAADPQALARIVNDNPTPENWGPGAPAVFRAADEGSALAAHIVDEAARHLELLVSRLLRQGAAGETVVAAGSVIVRQPRLAERLRARLARSHPSLTLRLLDVPPVAGGVVLARGRGGTPPVIP